MENASLVQRCKNRYWWGADSEQEGVGKTNVLLWERFRKELTEDEEKLERMWEGGVETKKKQTGDDEEDEKGSAAESRGGDRTP